MITIYDWFGYDFPINERYKLIKEAGFDGVLLWWSEYLNRNDYRNGPKIARDAGLYIENIHTPFQVQDYIWSDNADGEETMHCYLQCVEDCAEFEIPTMVIHLPDDDKPYNELGLYRLNKLCEKAGNLKIKIAFENLHNIMNLSYILDNIKSPYVGLCFDSCHQVRYYPDKDILSRYGDRLFALHLHDYNNDCIHRIPYDGISDWQDIMCKIKQTNYTGAVAIEAMNWGYPNVSPQKYLTMAFESAKKLVKLI